MDGSCEAVKDARMDQDVGEDREGQQGGQHFLLPEGQAKGSGLDRFLWEN